MADIQATLSARFDSLQKSVDATSAAVREQNQILLNQYRGIKWMRLPLTLQGPVVSNAIALGEEAGQVLGPRPGYMWSLRRLVVDGLANGGTPDIVNLYRNSSTGQPPLWQFNGNNFGYTFGKMEMVLEGGDTLRLVSVGSVTATGIIRLSGELLEVPAEMMAKIF